MPKHSVISDVISFHVISSSNPNLYLTLTLTQQQSLSTGKSTFTQTLLYDNPNYLDQPTTFPIFIVVLTLTQVGLYFGYLFVTQDFDFQDPDYDSIGGPEGMWMTAVEPYPTCKNVHKEFWR